MVIETNKDKGRIGLSFAIAYFSSQGYTISVPLNDTQWYDLVIEKDNIFQTVQVKFTASKDKEIRLTSNGGTKGTTYDNILDNPCDLLFAMTDEMKMYVIPIEDIRKSLSSVSLKLRTEPLSKFANANYLDTYKYLVQF